MDSLIDYAIAYALMGVAWYVAGWIGLLAVVGLAGVVHVVHRVRRGYWLPPEG